MHKTPIDVSTDLPQGITALDGKRIIFVFELLILGGAERQGLLLAKYLKHTCGAEVEVWGFRHTGRVTNECEDLGIPWRLVPFEWVLSRSRRVRSLITFTLALRAAKPDVILPYTMLPNIACALVWPYTGARVCVWNQRDAGLHRVGKRAESWAIQRIPLFIANSSSGTKFLAGTLRINPAKIRMINNGVSLRPAEADRAAWRHSLALSRSATVACMVANLHAHKDHKTLLRAWRKVLGGHPRTSEPPVLLLAGYSYGSTAEQLEALALELDLGKSVRFLGEVRDITGLLSAVDIGVFSSRLEGCPNGVLECMASGLPVAGTDIPGLRQALGPDGYGYLAPPGDADTLAKHILRFMAARDLRLRVGALNRQRIERDFSPERMVQQTASVLGTALQKTASRCSGSFPTVCL